MLVDIDKKAAEKTCNLIKKELPQTQLMVLGCDITDKADIEKTFDAILGNWGGLDILINATTSEPIDSLIDTPIEKFRKAVDINLAGSLLVAKAAAKIMIAQDLGGNIINVSSGSCHIAGTGQLHMSCRLAVELENYRIRVNNIWLHKTAGSACLCTDKGLADSVVFLCSEKASALTAQTLIVKSSNADTD